MRPHLDISHTGTLGAEDRLRMSFDENSISHLMSILTDLYSDPELAVIREYSINATDSHARAGLCKPIEVTLPNDLNPIFVVKDYGVGMSAREVYENFAKYGWSSKRDDDTEAGMLGLGCKSALTYTSQFTMITVKDGIENTVLITREADGAGAVQIVYTDETDDNDGVEIQVPVKDVQKFRNRAEWFYRFWEPGQVLVDGAEPFFYKSAANLELDPDIIITDQVDFDYIVMGNVPYPVPVEQRLIPNSGRNRIKLSGNTFSTSTAAFFTLNVSTTGSPAWQKSASNTTYTTNTSSYSKMHGINYGYKAIVRVPIGAVDFTPSREALQLNKRTMDVVKTAQLYIKHTFHRVAQSEINQASTYKEALKTARRWDAVWKSETFFYRGEEVPENFYPPENTWRWNSRNTECEKIGGYINDIQILDAIHIIGHFPKAVHFRTKERIREYLKQKGYDHKWIVFYDKKWGGGWFDECEKVPYEDIRAIKLPVTTSDGAPIIRSKCRTLISGGESIPVDAIPADAIWMNASDQRTDRKGLYTFLSECGRYGGTKKRLVLVTKEYEKRFIADNPLVPHISDYLKELAQTWINTLTPIESIELFHRGENVGLEGLHRLIQSNHVSADKIHDYELRGLILEVQGRRTDLRSMIDHFRMWLPKFGIKLNKVEGDLYTPVNLDADIARIKKILKGYPLIDWLPYGYGGKNSKIWDTFVGYVNDRYFLREGVHLSRAY